jgi:hypothetical protein
MKPKSVLEQLANQYTLPGGAFYMDEQGTIQTVETIAELKKYLMIKGATQVIFVKSIDRFVESDSSGVADEVTSWASTHPKTEGVTVGCYKLLRRHHLQSRHTWTLTKREAEL